MSSYLNQVLKDKLPDSTEVELHLFEFCNLNCSFCGQDHDSTVGMNVDSILDKANTVTQFMASNELDSHIVNLMGGEIFNDLVDDEMFEAYRAFRDRVNSWAADNGQTVRFNWVTNLIFERTERVERFISECDNSYISTSYDFAGRGLNAEKSTQFEANLNAFADRITVIGFVLTKQAIKRILTRIDPFFEKLYRNFTLYFDYYVPEKSASAMMPSEQEMYDVMCYIVKHYPNVYPVKDLIENERNQMTCYSLNKLTLLPDGEEVKCRYMTYDEGDFETPIDYTSNENIIEAHLERHGCLGCEWFDRCQFRCFVQADWTNLERMDDCMFRTFFNTMRSEGQLSNTPS